MHTQRRGHLHPPRRAREGRGGPQTTPPESVPRDRVCMSSPHFSSEERTELSFWADAMPCVCTKLWLGLRLGFPSKDRRELASRYACDSPRHITVIYTDTHNLRAVTDNSLNPSYRSCVGSLPVHGHQPSGSSSDVEDRLAEWREWMARMKKDRDSLPSSLRESLVVILTAAAASAYHRFGFFLSLA